ncbi:hypothetical protein ElyMa_002863500 [Elysia marginata]|uniref:Secreted protein n=1 Tax=Elysia marginata TaxID=1093978 RepID=A0AAV4HZW1_9GAST|nr:hypothetical protein ElyMa_002863500 [Elysia marginata]
MCPPKSPGHTGGQSVRAMSPASILRHLRQLTVTLCLDLICQKAFADDVMLGQYVCPCSSISGACVCVCASAIGGRGVGPVACLRGPHMDQGRPSDGRWRKP